MPRGKRKKNKTTEAKPEQPPQPEVTASLRSPLAEDSENEFEEIEQTLQQSLSYDTLTWMKYVIRVQAENVLKTKLKQMNVCSCEKLTIELNTLQRRFAELERDYKETTRKLKQELDDKNNHIKQLEAQIDVIDQQNRQKNVRIVGLEETETETTKEDIVKMMHLENFNISTNDIDEVHRFGKRGKSRTPRDTLVKFRSTATKEKVYKNRIAITKTMRGSGSGNAKANGKTFINDDLTKYRAKLLYNTRRLVKEQRLNATWSHCGNIMIKLSIKDKPIAVYTDQDVSNELRGTEINRKTDNLLQCEHESTMNSENTQLVN